VRGCPQKIAIPEYFALYNSYYREYGENKPTKFVIERAYYDNYKDSGKASSCIKCRACERACPQHIEITKWLEKVVAVLE